MVRNTSQARGPRILSLKIAMIAVILILPFTTGCLGNTESPPDESSDGGSGGGSGSVGFSMSDATYNEGSGGGNSNISVPFVLSAAAPDDLLISYTTEAVSATAGTDYTTTAGVLTLVAGSTGGNISIPIARDDLDENNETLKVSFLFISGSIDIAGSDNETVVTITDDDASPTISIADNSATEASAVGLAVTLSAVSGRDVTFSYRTEDPQLGTALPTLDYVEVPLTAVAVPAGSLTVNVTVQSIYDSLDEAAETVNVEILNPIGATLGTATAVATINDNTAAPVVSFSASEQDGYEGQSATIPVTAQLSTVSGRDVVVTITDATVGVGAGEYSVSSNTVTINAGNLTGSFDVTLNDDVDPEATEDLIFQFTTASIANSAGTVVGTAEHRLHIRESDTLPESLNNLLLKNMGMKISGTDVSSLAAARVCSIGDLDTDGDSEVMVLHRAVTKFPTTQLNMTPGSEYLVYESIIKGDPTNSVDLQLGSLLNTRGIVRELGASRKLYNETDNQLHCENIGDVTGSGKEAFYVQVDDNSIIFDGRKDIFNTGDVPAATALYDAADSTTTNAGFRLNAGANSFSLVTGDYNGDGISDYFVRSFASTILGIVQAGLAYSIIGMPALANHLGHPWQSTFYMFLPNAMFVPIISNIQAYGLLRIYSDTTNNSVAYRTQSIGDFDGDGIDDYLSGYGSYALIYGSATAREFVIQTATRTFNGTAAEGIDYTAWSDYANEASTRGTGDFNGDGMDDVVLGFAGSTAAIYIHSGQSGRAITTQAFSDNSSTFSRFTTDDDKLFNSMSWVGDLNLDGYDDIAYTSRDDLNIGLGEMRGAVYVMWGADNSSDHLFADRTLATLALQSLPTSATATRISKIVGEEVGDVISQVASAGDFNGDGVPDMIIGSSNADGANASGAVANAGAAYIVWGGDLTASLHDSSTAGVTFTDNSDSYVGTASENIFFGGRGNDTFDSGSAGTDVIYGGPGEDDITLRHQSFRRIDGGAGDDRLILIGTNLDLTSIGFNKFKNIESIDLSFDNNAQSLTLKAANVFKTNPLTDTIYVDCDANDLVTIMGSDWTSTGTSGGYEIIEDNNSTAQVRISTTCSATAVYP